MSELARTITDEHAAKILLPRGLDPKKVGKFGVYSVTKAEELPAEFQGHRYANVPGLVFTWHSPTRGDLVQLRPDEPIANPRGDAVKYLFPTGSEMVLTRLVDPAPDAPLLLAEGTCQSLAAALYAPNGWAVYGMSGCWNWRLGDTQTAIPDLMVADGRDVVIALDADAASNINVYNAGLALKEALLAEGAGTVNFLRLPGVGAKAGLDDVLGARPEDRRASYLLRLVTNPSEKPADKAPRATRSTVKRTLSAEGRPVIAVNEDRHDVINACTKALKEKWDGEYLFDHGGVLTRRHDATLEPVTDGIFGDLISEAAQCVTINSKGDASFAWPDEPTRKAVLSSRVREFSPLDRVSEVPFVRADGSIAQTNGYDEPSRAFLVLDDQASAIHVPDDPTSEDVQAAVKLLTVEWLGDFFSIMPEQADRANCLALVLTPLIRGLVPLAPMCVIDGLQMGVGKNLLADIISIFATGRPADPLPYSREDEENRKVITSGFRAGTEFFVFDEAHVIEGRALARSITGLTYSDRILGVSTLAQFPNRVTWLALGNNVQVNGDMSRRVFRVRLSPAVANPQDRSADEFRHPDIKRWTSDHRAELLGAALTLVRAWFTDERREENKAGRRFGSFEPWGGMVGGILDAAGVTGFLGNLTEFRAESDFEAGYWTDHFRWLAEKFGTDEFTVADVVSTMRRSNNVEHPPRLDDHDVKGYNRLLGQAYGRVRNRTFGGIQLVRVAESSSHGNRWQVREPEAGATQRDEDVTPDPGGSGGSGGSASATHVKFPKDNVNRAYKEVGANVIPPIPPIPPAVFEPSEGSDPLAELRPFAVEVEPRECPDCDLPEELVGPDFFWFACPRCSPGSFTRS